MCDAFGESPYFLLFLLLLSKAGNYYYYYYNQSTPICSIQLKNIFSALPLLRHYSSHCAIHLHTLTTKVVSQCGQCGRKWGLQSHSAICVLLAIDSHSHSKYTAAAADHWGCNGSKFEPFLAVALNGRPAKMPTCFNFVFAGQSCLPGICPSLLTTETTALPSSSYRTIGCQSGCNRCAIGKNEPTTAINWHSKL